MENNKIYENICIKCGKYFTIGKLSYNNRIKKNRSMELCSGCLNSIIRTKSDADRLYNKTYKFICNKCNKEFTIDRKGYKKRIKKNKTFELCTHCLKSKDDNEKLNNKIYNFRCSSCGKIFNINHKAYNNRIKNAKPLNLCSSCLKSIESTKIHKNRSIEKKEKIYKKVSESNKKNHKNRTKDQKKEINNKISISNKKFLHNMNNDEWIINQTNIAKSLEDKYNDINFIQENFLLKELEKRLKSLGYIFIREYPTIVLLDKNYKIDISIETLYCTDLKNILKCQIKDFNNNFRPGFRKNWDYLITIPWTEKRLFVDIDGSFHPVKYDFSDEFLTTTKGKYFNNRFNLNDVNDIQLYYDNRRENIDCNKILYKVNNMKDIDELMYKIMKHLPF